VSRTADWTTWTTRRRDVRSLAVLAGRLTDARRAGSAKTRTAGDAAIITRMAHVEIARRFAEGRLVRLGPREYELHPRQR
jgi:hypothetical protein